MARPVTDTDRRQILDLARSGCTRNDICRRTGRSSDTVSRVCADAGHSFDRAITAAATKARAEDARKLRTEEQYALLLTARRLREQLFAPAVLHAFAAKDGEHIEARVDEPPPKDKADLMRAYRDAMNTSLRLAQADGHNDEIEEVTSLLGNLFDTLELAAIEIKTQDADSGGQAAFTGEGA